MNQPQDQLAHRIAYRTARAIVEWTTTTVADAPQGVTPDPVLHGWNNLATPIRGEYEREQLAEAIKYLDSRRLLQRHPSRPNLARVLDTPSSQPASVHHLKVATA
ncbi:MAG TPA: hypothetical protein VFH59_17470 [Frateuria sp.]|uniref:hypothetical protein n=1 Tax=Frateuria sp. TaxID=2211372 RepID=UPI002D8100CE|nr:hypothetical protein [Frateuria sp.]HET6807229.1 hypothetical protein [Frateuria sp.]